MVVFAPPCSRPRPSRTRGKKADGEEHVEDKTDAHTGDKGCEIRHVTSADASASPGASVIKVFDDNAAVIVIAC